MLDLRTALRTLLGSSFNVSHAGPAGTVTVTINVADAGRDDEVALPDVVIMSQYGAGSPANIGGGASDNETYCELWLEALDSDTIDGALLLSDMHQAIEALVRASEKVIGSSHYTHVSSFRDTPPRVVDSMNVYVRSLSIRAQNLQTY